MKYIIRGITFLTQCENPQVFLQQFLSIGNTAEVWLKQAMWQLHKLENISIKDHKNSAVVSRKSKSEQFIAV